MIRREEIIGDCRLLLGDCLEIMPALGPVSAVVTDPPYGIAHASNHGASWQGRQIAGDKDTSVRDAALDGFDNVAAFGTWKTPPIPRTKGCLIWDKGPAFGMGDLAFPWKGSWELIYVRGRIWKGSRDEGVLRGHIQVSWESRGRAHPHAKPVSLIEVLLKKLPDDASVLDPFMGSGPTLVACANLGRRGIGIEIDEGYFDKACRRVEEAYRQQAQAIAAPREERVIDIRLEVLGNRTNATCSIWSADGREDTFSKIESTGAKALTALVEALSRDYAGHEWQVVGEPTLRGTVSVNRYRKPTISRKKLAELQARWC